MKFENTNVMNFDGAIRGARNPMNSWDKMDSHFDKNNNYIVGLNDMKLMQNLLKASIKEGNSHSKFLRQIMVCIDITAPMYWWSEFDTYKVGTVANSTSKMHKLASTPITMNCFETDDYDPGLPMCEPDEEGCIEDILDDIPDYMIEMLENIRQKYIMYNDKSKLPDLTNSEKQHCKRIAKKYWKELVRWLPESWLQTRTVTLNYQVLRTMYFDRRHHKLTEWHQFCSWVESLPYSKELIIYEGI